MTWDHVAAAVSAVALLSNVIAMAVGMVLRNAMLNVQKELSKELEEAKAELEETVGQHQRELVARQHDLRDAIERQSREFGETVSAMRTKIHDVEVWSRDTFVRRDDEIINSLRNGIERIEKRLQRWEEKTGAGQS